MKPQPINQPGQRHLRKRRKKHKRRLFPLHRREVYGISQKRGEGSVRGGVSNLPNTIIDGHKFSTCEMPCKRDHGDDHHNAVASARRITRAPPRKCNKPDELEASGPSLILPQELVFEILSRLPVKSLLRFRCVCKSWKSLISDPQFVKNHLHRSITDPSFSHHRLVPTSESGGHVRIPFALQSFFNDSSYLEETVSPPLKLSDLIVGLCNGLICLVELECDSDYVRLYNPTTQLDSQRSPNLITSEELSVLGYTRFGFGYDDVTDKYKVVAISCDPEAETVAEVYTSGEDSWRQFHTFPYTVLHMGTFLSGTLNWLAIRSNSSEVASYNKFMVSFDVGKERWSEILLPVFHKEHIYFTVPTLGVLRDCLCLSYQYACEAYFVVWVMKEYGVRESWTILVNVSCMDLGVDRNLFPEPVFMAENGEVLLQTYASKFVLYNPRDKGFKFLEVQGAKGWYDLKIYVESLVSPCF